MAFDTEKTLVTGRRWWTLAVVATAQLLVVLDGTIVNIALPSAQGSLEMTDGDRHWVITAYALTFGGLLLIGGRVSGALGHRRAFLAGLLGFAAASALGGAAATPDLLFGARALQGMFAALLAPAALSLLTMTFTGRDRGRAFGVFAAVGAAGSAVGLIAGGLLTEYAGWRWCLYVNVPIALVAALGVRLIPADRADQPSWASQAARAGHADQTGQAADRVGQASNADQAGRASRAARPSRPSRAARPSRPSRAARPSSPSRAARADQTDQMNPAPHGRGRLDAGGALLSLAGFAALVYGFAQAEPLGWGSVRVWALLTGGLALLAAFAALQSRVSRPLLPPHVLRHRGRAAAFVSVTLLFVAMFGFYLFMSYYTQTVLGYSPVRAGLTLIVNAVAALAGSVFVAGRLHGRVRPATLMVPGLLAAAAGMLLLTGLTAGTPHVFTLYLLPAMVLTGLGLGCVLSPTASLATEGMRGDAVGAASAAYNAAQQVGAAMGTALLNTVAAAATAAHIGSAPAAAAVHGYTVALGAGAAILVAAAALTALLLGPHRRPPSRPS